MSAKSHWGHKDWDVYSEEEVVGKCKCGEGNIINIYTVASHEKYWKVERDLEETIVRCNNPDCPSK